MLIRGTTSLLVCAFMACSSTTTSVPPSPVSIDYTAPEGKSEFYETISRRRTSTPPPEEQRVNLAVDRVSKQTRKNLHSDKRLDDVARWILKNLNEVGQVPPTSAMDFAAHHLGLPEPSPHMLLLSLSDSEQLDAEIEERIREALSRHDYTHYGVAVQTKDDVYTIVVLFSWRWFQMVPIARSIRPGASITLTGQLSPGLVKPSVVVTKPEGPNFEQKAGVGDQFNISIRADQMGIYRVELLAHGRHGPTVIANFPVYVGVTVPQSTSSLDVKTVDTKIDPTTFAEQLLLLANRTRADSKLPPLKKHNSLSNVAESHSFDMRDNGFIGHTSPSTGEPAQRVAAAGIQTNIVMENVGRGYSPEEVHYGLMRSPAHAANILSPDATHMGIGVVRHKDENQPDKPAAFLVTELFIRINPPIDPEEAPEDIVDMINESRERLGQEDIEINQGLSEYAQQAAAEYFENPTLSEKQITERLSKKFDREMSRFKSIGALFKLVNSLDEIKQIKQLFDSGVREVGIGVAQGTRKGGIPNTIAFVAILTWPR